MAIIEPAADGICLNVRVIARARKTELAGTRDDALLVRLNAPPVDGAANDELVAFIASILNLPRRNVAIQSGARSRHKRLRVTGIEPAAAAVHLRCT
jgi:uncharacterized protein (TIGR00251 family)